jgi:hypothetical protein
MGGMLASASGTYEQLNVFGRATGHRVAVEKGDPLAAVARGFRWRPEDRRWVRDALSRPRLARPTG